MRNATRRIVTLAVVCLVGTSFGCGSLEVGIGGGGGSSGISFGGRRGFSTDLLSATGGANSAKWAAAIAAGSYVANEIVQAEVERRRAKHERESEYLDAEIEDAEEQIDERETELAKIEKELARQRTAVADLEKRSRANASFKSRAKKTLAELNDLIKRLDTEKEVAEAEIEIYTEAVRSSKSKTDDSVSKEELEQRRRTLLAKRDERLRQYKLVVERGKSARSLRERVVSLNS